MHALRASVFGHRHIAILILALALAMKALIPAGTMISAGSQLLTISICSGVDGSETTTTIAVPVKKSAPGDHDDSGKTGGQCAFSALSLVAIGGADAALLALAFAFILVLGLAPARRLPARRNLRIRPPLRGPPATA